MRHDTGSRGGGGGLGRRVLYWLTVAIVSVALVVALLLFLESCDDSTVGAVASSRD